ncbi:MAG: phosphatidylserine decarboxylase [Desulfomonile tiedjei]|uniref:Phosphatidylserine decarboxylase n=1 Tax=Desulfomonile tiedjei TaxID=2358 RepID=A0A9D6Z393_9BACT|nr:phosphatidylserine decarboxylase [Desulfomonile tiedjei]
METTPLIFFLILVLFIISGYLYWRYVWFFRNPPRTAPAGDNIVSPADGTVVYVKIVEPQDDVIVIKQGVAARIKDILRQDVDSRKILIGIFMSPFDVHHNRAPVAGTVETIVHYPAKTENVHMGPMHYRILFNQPPFYRNSLHILENERTVTRIKGKYKGDEMSCYVVQIAGKSVNGIDSYIPEGGQVGKGEEFGMIRIGSQVDLVIPQLPEMRTRVRPGDRVRAGESVLVD